MEKYTHIFIKLRKFAPHPDEREFALRYVVGLSYHIQIHMVGLCCETMDRAIATGMFVEGERELFRTKQHRESGKGKSLVLTRSCSILVSCIGSTFRATIGRKLKNWFTGGSSRDQSMSQTPQQRRPP